MAGYFENTTFGMTGIDLTGVSTAVYAGANVTKGKNTQTSAKLAGGLDWGTDAGTFNLKLNINIRTLKKIAGATKLTFSLMSSSDNSTFEEIATYTVSATSLNASVLKNNIVFSAVPTMGRYFCIGIKPDAAATAGMLLISCDPKGY